MVSVKSWCMDGRARRLLSSDQPGLHGESQVSPDHQRSCLKCETRKQTTQRLMKEVVATEFGLMGLGK